jgi:hypothetical protein
MVSVDLTRIDGIDVTTALAVMGGAYSLTSIPDNISLQSKFLGSPFGCLVTDDTDFNTGSDHKNYYCYSRSTCHANEGTICMARC